MDFIAYVAEDINNEFMRSALASTAFCLLAHKIVDKNRTAATRVSFPWSSTPSGVPSRPKMRVHALTKCLA
jgi:hypothetical protein